MTRRWICNNCNEETSEPPVRVYRYHGTQPDETVYCCPYCGSDDLEEMKRCDNIVRGQLCSGWHRPDKRLCPDCWHDLSVRVRMLLDSLTSEEEDAIDDMADGVSIKDWRGLLETR